MRIRRIATAAATSLVAIVVALAIPTSQLRTVSFIEWCCCGNPAKCHCPHEKPKAPNDQPTMGTCHDTEVRVVAPQLPSFAASDVALAAPPVHAMPAPILALASPHAPPSPARPSAPS